MLPEEALQCQDQRFGICKAFVLVREIRFLFNKDFRMGIEDKPVVKRKMPDDT